MEKKNQNRARTWGFAGKQKSQKREGLGRIPKENIDQGESEDESTAQPKHQDLAGVKDLHGLDKVMEGGAVVLTLKDQSILADGDIKSNKREGGPEYFFTQLKKKGKKGCKRFDRTVRNNGNWHATQTKKILDESGEKVARFLKSFVFKGDEKDHWNMDEFLLTNKNDYVFSRIKNNKKRKFGDCYDDNGEAVVPVPVPDLEPVTKAAQHDQFFSASTSCYLNNSREVDAPLISPASCKSRDVEFIEDKFNSNSDFSAPTISLEIDSNVGSSRENESVVYNNTTEPRRSQRARKEKILDPDFIDSQAIAFLVEGDRENILKEIPIHNNADKCIYSKFTDAYGVIICLYVDDLLIFGTNLEGIFETKEYLNSRFKMKDLNEIDTVLGIKVKKHSGGYALSQSHYIEKMLLKF
ncbi:hypothetical protein RJ639_000013 [Escallonia herrerae]|uniref:NAC domain-containing protein n=1 Tax=Escallonia herrerae TaxID=1293975 RepID=A0AA89BGP7_9ASTE|nr:hypothetical protein RJ639_000013 [Escallonia herrerae]